MTSVIRGDDNLDSAQLLQKKVTLALSGANVPFPDIPAWVDQLKLAVRGMSVTGAVIPLLRINGIAVGYLSAASTMSTAVASVNGTTGIPLAGSNTVDATTFHGIIELVREGTNNWVVTSQLAISNGSATFIGAGSLALGTDLVSLALDAAGSAFDAGSATLYMTGAQG